MSQINYEDDNQSDEPSPNRIQSICKIDLTLQVVSSIEKEPNIIVFQGEMTYNSIITVCLGSKLIAKDASSYHRLIYLVSSGQTLIKNLRYSQEQDRFKWHPPSLEGKVEKPRASLIELISIYKDKNKMTNNSIRQLIKRNWSKLAVINMCNQFGKEEQNNLKNFEFNNLVYAEYPNIKSLQSCSRKFQIILDVRIINSYAILLVYFKFKPTTQKQKDELISMFRIKFGRVKVQI